MNEDHREDAKGEEEEAGESKEEGLVDDEPPLMRFCTDLRMSSITLDLRLSWKNSSTPPGRGLDR